jgi:hypothetical protein
LAIPGVHAVGIGRKIVGGESTAEAAIMVFVEHKRPVGALDPAHVIPAEIDGVKTDVYESEIPRHHEDTSSPRPLVGGLQIIPGDYNEDLFDNDYQGLGGKGTLGCFIKVDELVAPVYAVTCWHVVGTHTVATPPNLKWSVGTGATSQLVTTPADAVVPSGTQLLVEIFANHIQYNAFYTTQPSDTAATIAQNLAQIVHALGIKYGNGLSATAAPDGTLSVQWPGGTPGVTYPGPYGPTRDDTSASTKVSVVRASLVPPHWTLSFSGDVDPYGGLYLTVNAGGTEPTRGVFIATSLNLPADVVNAINGMQIDGVSADHPTTNTVTVNGAQTILCKVTSDARVGQSTNRFCTSSCSRCCDRRIGVVQFARLDLDVALIQLDAGLQYQAQVKGITARIIGVHDVAQDTRNDVALTLRGRSSTDRTYGFLVAFNTNGVVRPVPGVGNIGDPPTAELDRWYTNAFSIRPKVAQTLFSQPGDSGAAVLTEPVAAADGSNTTMVAGILFAGSTTLSLATPIQPILDAVTAWRGEQTATIATADSMAEIDVVAGSPSPNALSPALSRVAHRELTPLGTESARLAQVQREISATPGGQRYGPLIMRHLDEAQTLVNTNRKMATVWHRNGGPAITDALLRTLEIPGQRIPAVINGTPLEDCLQQIASALARYGSDALAADIKAYGSALIQLAHLTYPELVQTLELAH